MTSSNIWPNMWVGTFTCCFSPNSSSMLLNDFVLWSCSLSMWMLKSPTHNRRRWEEVTNRPQMSLVKSRNKGKLREGALYTITAFSWFEPRLIASSTASHAPEWCSWSKFIFKNFLCKTAIPPPLRFRRRKLRYANQGGVAALKNKAYMRHSAWLS